MIDPRGLSVGAWCDSTAQSLASLGTIPKLGSEDQWELWALIVTQIPEIATFIPPDPRMFKNWFEWAMRFVQTVPL